MKRPNPTRRFPYKPIRRKFAQGAFTPAGGTITINAGMGANGKEIGERIVQAIKGYEQRNGPGWRNDQPDDPEEPA